MTIFPRTAQLASVLAVAVIPLGFVSCSSGSTGSSASSNSSAAGAEAAACPTAPVDVVVSVDQWGDIASQLGGRCATVKTILASSSVDPHDYEPSPSDGQAFAGAQMVVVNGVDYDPWASRLAATSAPKAPVVDAGKVTGTPEGANPHLWYKPDAITATADAITAELTKLDPQADSYFKDRRAAFTTALQPYTDLEAKIKAGAAGKSYAATETVFDYQAQAVGLTDKTPQGYQNASANETDPTPADIAAFTTALAGKQIDVLIYNTQTEGSVPQQIRAAAEKANIPVVEVTETVPPGQNSFVGWQDAQLTALAKALGVSV